MKYADEVTERSDPLEDLSRDEDYGNAAPSDWGQNKGGVNLL